MRQVYRAGEKPFVNYAGPKFEVVDPEHAGLSERAPHEACRPFPYVPPRQARRRPPARPASGGDFQRGA